jgi:hypothetical protein
MTDLTGITHENKFQDCVYIEPTVNRKNEKANLLFTIVFGKHLESNTFFGEIRFGIKRGELRLEIENGKLFPSDIEFIQVYSIATTVAIEEEQADTRSSTKKVGATTKGTYSISPSVESTLNAEEERTDEMGKKTKYSFTKKKYHLKANWDFTKPRWEFYNQMLDVLLDGMVEKLRFATITIEGSPLIVRYTFDVKPKDISYTELHHFLDAEKVNKNKMIKHLLTRRFLKGTNTFCSGEIIL